MDHSVFWTG